MFNYHPAIKIVVVFLLCSQMAYYNYLMFNAYEFATTVKETPILKVGAVLYLLTFLFFADYYWRQKLFVILMLWILLSVAFCVNGIIFISGNTPPLFVQYSQSGILVAFSVLLAMHKNKFPNWLRIFSLANLLALIPCLYLYFAKEWFAYEIVVYIICFTPVIKSFVFIDERLKSTPEVIDD